MARLARFDPLVGDYDRARPGYPPELFEAIAKFCGTLRGAHVLEVGAGTGLATRGLLEAGADVVAVDVSIQMLLRLRTKPWAPPVVLADGNALPIVSDWADLVCYAQSWHWVGESAAREAVRVLQPGGWLALWWNDVDAVDEDWWKAQQSRLEKANPRYRRDYRAMDVPANLRGTGLFGRIQRWETRWSRELDLDSYLAWLRSKSYVAQLGKDLPEFLDAERRSLSAAFPTGLVREPFVCRLWLAQISN